MMRNIEQWVKCLTHACVFPKGWEAEHAAGPIALGNGPCQLEDD